MIGSFYEHPFCQIRMEEIESESNFYEFFVNGDIFIISSDPNWARYGLVVSCCESIKSSIIFNLLLLIFKYHLFFGLYMLQSIQVPSLHWQSIMQRIGSPAQGLASCSNRTQCYAMLDDVPNMITTKMDKAWCRCDRVQIN